jgi:hypothetical protein
MRVATKILLASMITACAAAAESGLVALASGAPYPAAHADVYSAVESKLRTSGRMPENYHARVEACDPDACAIAVFSRDVLTDPREGGLPKSCPGDYCGTMKYSKRSQSITSVIRWK